MKKALIAMTAAAFLACGCATQSKSVATDTLSAEKQSEFHQLAREISNPCAESSLAQYETLDALLESGKTCRAAHILSKEITFFLQKDVSASQILKMVGEEAADLADPKSFVVENRPRLGSDSAPVQIVIFSDFQCPFCARAAKTMHKVYEARPEDVSIVFKQMPLTNIHMFAAAAALITTYAHEQGRFWEFHDKFFENQKEIGPDMMTQALEELGTTQEDLLNPEISEKYALTILEDMDDAKKSGVQGTPTVYLNGVSISGASSFEHMMARIDAELSAPSDATTAETTP